jgi:hypothetical protein
MARSNAERQRDYRQRMAGGGQAGPKCPGCRARDAELAAWKDEARRWGEERKAEIAALREQVAKLEAQ